MRLVTLSDTHLKTSALRVPDGDVLIHAGDLCSRGSFAELLDAAAWLATLPHPCKLVIAGNHDWACQRQPAAARAALERDPSLHYLQDSEFAVGGLRFWGSPWQPRFNDWAFNLDPPQLAERWAKIPAGIDVLVTHGPPFGHGDLTLRGPRVGCPALLAAVQRVRPRLHVFGHIHEGYGVTEADGTLYVNASLCTLAYHPTNLPVVLDFDCRLSRSSDSPVSVVSAPRPEGYTQVGGKAGGTPTTGVPTPLSSLMTPPGTRHLPGGS